MQASSVQLSGGACSTGIECLSIDAVHHGAVQIDGWRHVAAVRGVGICCCTLGSRQAVAQMMDEKNDAYFFAAWLDQSADARKFCLYLQVYAA